MEFEFVEDVLCDSEVKIEGVDVQVVGRLCGIDLLFGWLAPCLIVETMLKGTGESRYWQNKNLADLLLAFFIVRCRRFGGSDQGWRFDAVDICLRK